MEILEYADYLTLHDGTELNEEEFNTLVVRASDIIDMLTHYTLVTDPYYEFSSLPTFIQTNLKKAVIAQVEYMHSHEGNSVVEGDPIQNVTIGSFSYSEGTGSGSSQGITKAINPIVYEYLRPTGLLYRGVRSYGH